jgi:hypothetical protein
MNTLDYHRNSAHGNIDRVTASTPEQKHPPVNPSARHVCFHLRGKLLMLLKIFASHGSPKTEAFNFKWPAVTGAAPATIPERDTPPPSTAYP